MKSARKAPRPGRVAGAAASLLVVATAAGAADFVNIEHVEMDQLHEVSFRLEQPRTVQIDCEGAGDAQEDELYAYGWILNRDRHEVVWQLQAETAASGPGLNRRWRGSIELPAGVFTAYFAPYTQHYKAVRLLGKEWFKIWIKRDAKMPRESKRWHLRLAVADDEIGAVEVSEPRRSSDPRRFVDLTPMGDNAFVTRAFRLSERQPITIYCQGEYADDERGAVDGGWIVDAKTRKPVWEFGPDNFKSGGGDSKNKVSRETISLPAGEYVAAYSTDDSHSHEAWNSPPPYDPDGWGLILWAESDAQGRRIAVYDEADDASRTLVTLAPMGDGVDVRQGFTLRRAAQVRVYCLGEYSESAGAFVDLGQIAKFGGEAVWTLEEENSRRAGGARKNRVADEIVQLGAGDYVVSYSTDDSHAYGAWNAAPPRDPRHWGITLYATSDPDAKDVKLFDEAARSEANDKKNYLARVVRVRSSKHVTARFTLTAPTLVHIVAVGEGLYNEMYDYGWIEAVPSHTWVWEMTMRNTRHAGGAEKNRRFDGTMRLDAGTYEVHFVTDGSHAWNEWNQPKPKDPDAWGISVSVAPR